VKSKLLLLKSGTTVTLWFW